MMFGAMFTQAVGAGTWILGFIMHLIAGIVLALIYAWGYYWWGRSGSREGAVLSIPHTLIAGVLIIFMPMIHPAVPEHPAFEAQGFMAFNIGVGAGIGFIMVHLLFGIVVGAVYGRRRRP